MVPDKLDQENPVSVQLLNPGPHIRAASKLVAGFPELLDSAADFLVFVRNDVDEGSVSADRLLDPGDHGLVLEAQVGQQFVLEEPQRLVEDDPILLSSFPRRHHLVERRLELRQLVDEVRMGCNQGGERVVGRYVAHRRAPRGCRPKRVRVSARSSRVRRSFPHSRSIPFFFRTPRASSYVIRSNGGFTAFRNSTVRPIATTSSGRSSATGWHAWEMTPSACLITSSMPAHASSISACQYSVRCRVVRDFSARNDGPM